MELTPGRRARVSLVTVYVYSKNDFVHFGVLHFLACSCSHLKKGKFAPKQRHINIYPAHCSPTHKLIEGGNISPDEAPLNVASTTATAAAVFEISTMLLLLAYRTINRLLLHKHPMLLADPACSPLLGDGLLAVKTHTHTEAD